MIPRLPPLVCWNLLPYSPAMLLVTQFIDVLVFLLFADVLLSWVLQPHQFPLNYTRTLTEPMYAPLRKLINPQQMGGLDLSPLIWIIGLQILGGMLGG